MSCPLAISSTSVGGIGSPAFCLRVRSAMSALIRVTCSGRGQEHGVRAGAGWVQSGRAARERRGRGVCASAKKAASLPQHARRCGGGGGAPPWSGAGTPCSPRAGRRTSCGRPRQRGSPKTPARRHASSPVMACISLVFCRCALGLGGVREAAAAHHEHRVAAANGPSHPEARRHALPPAEPAHARC